MAESIRIPGRFNGPRDSGNGGYAAGVVAGLLGGEAEVSLRSPVPLDTEMAVLRDGEAVQVLDGETLVADARAAELDLEPPAVVSADEARLAATRFRGSEQDVFSTCFVCGKSREAFRHLSNILITLLYSPRMSDARIGHLFPAGGPVPPSLVIGREDAMQELNRRVEEGIHTMLTGARRIGKTTVCNAVCDRLSESGSIVIQIEVPESEDTEALLQQIVDRSSGRNSPAARGRRLFKVGRPLLEKALAEAGVPLDLSEFDGEPSLHAARTVLSLPSRLGKELGQPVIFYLDELQRAADYVGGEHLLRDLVDLYSGQTDVVLLVDGSSERTSERMMGAPVGFGKLVDRLPLADEIPARIWRASLPVRFEQAALTIQPEALEMLISFGEGRPYATMAAARYAALNARKLGSDAVEEFEAAEGIAEARRHLEEDGQ